MPFKPEYQPLSKDQAELFLVLMSRGEPKELPSGFSLLSDIVKKRIDGLKLPISFTPSGLAAVNALASNPGQAVVVLIDTLTKFVSDENYQNWKNETPPTVIPKISVKDLCLVYPWGFYTESSFEDYIDNYLKEKSVKWSEIY